MTNPESHLSFHEIILTLLGEKGVNTLKGLPPKNISLTPGGIGWFNDPTLPSRRKIPYDSLEDDENRRNTQLKIVRLIEDAIHSGDLVSPDNISPQGIDNLEFRIDFTSFFLWLKKSPEHLIQINTLLASLDRELPKSWKDMIKIGKDKSESIAEGNKVETNYLKDEIKKSALHEQIIFFRKGSNWTVGNKTIKDIPHSKGMTYIQYLLLQPNKSCPSLNLELLENKMEHLSIGLINNEKYQTEQIYPTSEIDASYKTLLKEVLEMKGDFERAVEENPAEANILKEELEKHQYLLNSLYTKEGQLRENMSEEEKSRKRVSKAIKVAKDKISDELPELSELLKEIKAGSSPIYSPSNSDRPVNIILNS